MINIIGLSLCWVGELFMRPRGVGFGNEGCPQGNEQCSPGYEGCVKGNAYDTVSTGFFQVTDWRYVHANISDVLLLANTTLTSPS
eukprot:1344473-Amorphochlora_amoeboformis.AAC.1